MKTTQILKIANRFEESGKGFFSRAGTDMNIWVREGRVNDPNQWPHAQDLYQELGFQCDAPVFDNQSGHILVRVPNAYKGAL